MWNKLKSQQKDSWAYIFQTIALISMAFSLNLQEIIGGACKFSDQQFSNYINDKHETGGSGEEFTREEQPSNLKMAADISVSPP